MPSPRALRYFALAAVLVASLVLVGKHDFSIGVDAGVHHAFAEQLAAFGQWPLPPQSYLTNIAHYPPAAHTLGVLLGSAVGSTFHGMLVVNALALFVVYLALSSFIQRTSAAEAIGSLIIFVSAALVFRRLRFITGNEVVANFFFGQFAGTAAMLTGFILLAHARWRFPVWLAAAAAITHVVGWFFPLSAIQLAVGAAALRLRPSDYLDGLSTRLREGAVTGVVLAVVAGVHPTMADMVNISGNDGGISITDTTMLVATAFLCLMAIPALIYVAPRSNLLHGNALVALAIGVAVPCLLQFVMLAVFGLGSPYAVKKSGFLIGTLSLLIFSCLAMEWRPLKDLALRLTLPPLVPYAARLVGPAMVAIALLLVFAGRPRTPVSEIAAYDSQLKPFVAQHPELLRVSVAMTGTFDPHVNYVVGFARLHPPLAVQFVQNALLPPAPKLIAGAKFAIVGAAQAKALPTDCVFADDGQLAAVRTRCIGGDRGGIRSD